MSVALRSSAERRVERILDPRWSHYGAPAHAGLADQRCRIVLALAEVIPRHGYDRTTVELIVRAAGISRRTFYDLFSSKSAAFLAAHEAAQASLFAHVRSSFSADAPCSERIEAVIAAAFAWAAADPDRALLVCGHVFTAGPHAALCYDRLLTGFASVFGPPPRGRGAGPLSFRQEAAIAGLACLVAGRLCRDDGASLRSLTPSLGAIVHSDPAGCR